MSQKERSGFSQLKGEIVNFQVRLQACSNRFIFASSCENMTNILLESMASGLPIASSNYGPMTEVLGNAGVYFDPESPQEIARALRALIDSPELREEKARIAFERVKVYSWERCARDTFRFLAGMASRSGSSSSQAAMA